ncbi:hypothetical protein OH77DRAFT_1430249 [Trametes cingulata]|nr:hypothetical protein OH77DRAFT_1430249 [Trametes cingulata]
MSIGDVGGACWLGPCCAIVYHVPVCTLAVYAYTMYGKDGYQGLSYPSSSGQKSPPSRSEL